MVPLTWAASGVCAGMGGEDAALAMSASLLVAQIPGASVLAAGEVGTPGGVTN